MGLNILMRSNQQIQAFIFDMDGVLFSTQEANDKAYRSALEEHQLIVPSNFYKRLYGNKFERVIKEDHPNISDEKISAIKKSKHIHYAKRLPEIKENKSLIEFIRFYRGQLPIGLATSAAKNNAQMILKHFHAEELFDAIVYFEDVKNPKPSPECFLLCAERLGVHIQNCLIWEDSQEGIEAAQKAGATFIKVTF